MARTYRRVTRLALLNESHSVSNFLLAERGLARYPPYSVHRTRSAFHCLEQMEEYEAALEVRTACVFRPIRLLVLRYSLSRLCSVCSNILLSFAYGAAWIQMCCVIIAPCVLWSDACDAVVQCHADVVEVSTNFWSDHHAVRRWLTGACSKLGCTS